MSNLRYGSKVSPGYGSKQAPQKGRCLFEAKLEAYRLQPQGRQPFKIKYTFWI